MVPDIQHFSIWCFVNRFDKMSCPVSHIRSLYAGQIIHAGTVEPFEVARAEPVV